MISRYSLQPGAVSTFVFIRRNMRFRGAEPRPGTGLLPAAPVPSRTAALRPQRGKAGPALGDFRTSPGRGQPGPTAFCPSACGGTLRPPHLCQGIRKKRGFQVELYSGQNLMPKQKSLHRGSGLSRDRERSPPI